MSHSFFYKYHDLRWSLSADTMGLYVDHASTVRVNQLGSKEACEIQMVSCHGEPIA